MLDFHLASGATGEGELCDSGTCFAVHDRYGTPISAHPDLVFPNGETSAGGVLRPFGYANLILKNNKKK
jgi:hypothetical protein